MKSLQILLIPILILLLVSCDAPQSRPVPPVAPPKPSASPEVVLFVQSAEKGTVDGRDLAMVRFFIANRDRLTPQDIDYLADHLYYNIFKALIVSEYYGRPLVSQPIEEKH